MKYIKLFEQHQSEEEIHAICEKYNIINYTINSDMSIDTNEDVDFSHCGLRELPLTFNIVNNGFMCSDNRLTTLKGAPRIVNGDFYCSNNKLTSLEGGPDIVSGYYSCDNNKLITLNGSPNKIDIDFDCEKNQLISLDGCPEIIGNSFYCSYNELTNLKYGPKEIYEEFGCYGNKLPREIVNFDHKKIVLKYQDEYGIWNEDGSLNKGRWDIFLKDYKIGRLT